MHELMKSSNDTGDADGRVKPKCGPPQLRNPSVVSQIHTIVVEAQEAFFFFSPAGLRQRSVFVVCVAAWLQSVWFCLSPRGERSAHQTRLW